MVTVRLYAYRCLRQLLSADCSWVPSSDFPSNAWCPTRKNSLAIANGSTGFSAGKAGDPETIIDRHAMQRLQFTSQH